MDSSSLEIDPAIAAKTRACGKQMKVQTSWTKGNPGRRFAHCGGLEHSGVCKHMAKQGSPVQKEVRNTADGWTFNENWRFMANLTHEAKNANLNDLAVLNDSCKVIQDKLEAHFGRRYTKKAIKMKVEQMRARHNSFKKFISTPGVVYDMENIDSTVTAEYWKKFTHEAEPEMFKQFRKNGNPIHYMLTETFNEKGVATFPKDLSGSPRWPIHVRDSDEDEKALVPADDLSGMEIPMMGEAEDVHLIKDCCHHVVSTDLETVEDSEEDIVGGSNWVDLD
ncbi:hypothetical protein ACJIZ3_003616 [Penstemon smallii]|uniref:Myb/SANT-like domain-containing protein n=1 Tax=Penstemon smallii TaxID=265156 RepID=A0ABD3UDK1_9LAMI